MGKGLALKKEEGRNPADRKTACVNLLFHVIFTSSATLCEFEVKLGKKILVYLDLLRGSGVMILLDVVLCLCARMRVLRRSNDSH
ncbi:hypothetical protein TNCT_336211 [Trichonephila clavata]|uniref:Transmembrane protein n=1 Tax=Trichonephila clavata TaxID=2740835 RepID=A0A8X6LC77_TRICU|nr:hypothetical protein TNCT_336211 [Trichonephila clavata]